MKIYLAASKRGKSKFGEFYSRIYNHIEKLGHKNLDDLIIKGEPEEFYGAIAKEGEKKFEEVFEHALTKLKEADVTVFECTEQSFSIGYLVQKSLELNKPCVVLYQEQNYPPSYFLLGSQDEKLIVRHYNTDTLEKVLEEALNKGSTVADKRFNFFISSSLLAFLNQSAREQNITKSTLIRNLIIEHRKKNART